MMLKRYKGFLDDDGSVQWWAVRNHLKSRLWVAWFRIHNRWMDARAVLAGACNATTWDPEQMDYAGGYSHWRCGKRRGHLKGALVTGHEDGSSGPHRFINCIWQGPGSRVEHAPLPIRQPGLARWFDTSAVLPFRKLADGRHAVDYRRRARQRAKHQKVWMDNRLVQIRRAQETRGAVRPD